MQIKSYRSKGQLIYETFSIPAILAEDNGLTSALRIPFRSVALQ